MEKAIASAETEAARGESEHVLARSKRGNWTIGEIVRGIPPFPGVRESFRRLAGVANVVVVSATPIEALLREWSEHNIASDAALICGQEMGPTAEHIAAVSNGSVGEKVLMVGDSPSDLNASTANGILFHPIIPGDEEASWSQLLEEGFGRFFAKTCCGPYEQRLLERFHQALPDEPPWKEIT